MTTAARHRLLQAVPASIVAHAALLALALLVAADRSGTASTEDGGGEQTIVELTELDDPPMIDDADEGGAPVGASASGQQTEPRARSRSAPVKRSAPEDLETATSEIGTPAVRVGDIVGDLDGALVGGVGLSVGGGGLGGRGGGTGTAIGDGQGIGKRAGPPLAPASKARPALLIHPRRTRKIDAARLFVIRVTVDVDGYVAGARLVRGIDPHLDGKALDAIWRFRYRPALDDDGKPVESQLEQRFMLRW